MTFHEGGYQLLIGLPVATQAMGRHIEGTMKKKGRSVVQGLSKRYFRMNPCEAVPLEPKIPETRRRKGKRYDCGTDIVNKTGKGQLGGAGASADGGLGLQQEYRVKGIT